MILQYRNWKARISEAGQIVNRGVAVDWLKAYMERCLFVLGPLVLDSELIEVNLASFWPLVLKFKRRVLLGKMSHEERCRQVRIAWDGAWSAIENEAMFRYAQEAGASEETRKSFFIGLEFPQWPKGRSEESYFSYLIFDRFVEDSSQLERIQVLRELCPKQVCTPLIVRAFGDLTRGSAAIYCWERKLQEMLIADGLHSPQLFRLLTVLDYWHATADVVVEEIKSFLNQCFEVVKSGARLYTPRNHFQPWFSRVFKAFGVYSAVKRGVDQVSEEWPDGYAPFIAHILFLRDTVLKGYEADPFEVRRDLFRALLNEGLEQANAKMTVTLARYVGCVPRWLYESFMVGNDLIQQQAQLRETETKEQSQQRAIADSMERVQRTLQFWTHEKFLEALINPQWIAKGRATVPVERKVYEAMPKACHFPDGCHMYINTSARSPHGIISITFDDYGPHSAYHISSIVRMLLNRRFENQYVQGSVYRRGQELIFSLSAERRKVLEEYLWGVDRATRAVIIDELCGRIPFEEHRLALREKLAERFTFPSK